MATRARLSQDRSRIRREELLDATIELFAEGGARGITHRAVASKAGLPPATTTYYFNSIEKLIEEALSRHIESWLHDLEELTETPVEFSISLDAANSVISAVFAARSTELVGLQLAIYLAAARNPDLRSKAAESLNALEDLVAKLLNSVGIVDSAGLAESVVRVVAGSAFSRLSERHTVMEEAAVVHRAIRGLVVAELLSEEETAAKLLELNDDAPLPA